MKYYLELNVYMLYLLPILIGFQEIYCLHITSDKVSIELRTVTNVTDARLECRYDLDDDILYSIKWYKGHREFYRYHPNEVPKAKIFTTLGLNVDINNSNSTVVVLNAINHSNSGLYKCEVTGEPSFETVYQEAELVV